MSFTELKAFDAVARHGSFVKAAQELGRSQPTLTTQVAQLEKAYDTELIIRSRGKIKGLTPLGESLREITRSLVALEQDANNLLRDAGNLNSGEVRIAATAPVMVVRLTKVFKERHPNVDCHLEFGNSERILQSILQCDADFGILGGSVDHTDCVAIPISKPEIVLVGSNDHPATESGVLSRKAFAKETLLIREPGSETRELMLTKIQQYHYAPARLVEIGSRSGAIAAARAGMGLAAVSEHEIEASEGLSIVRLESFRVFGVNHAVFLKNRSQARLLQVLLDCCNYLT
ncbi:LysR substrate-binding domain-containing protein [Cognatishimia maritima]|uniref:DNA-binding transcriptional regulator, LysR family n=1 Tax=Cognatishimia maritima TaxID=870908 RepID=A0A1M5VKJ6_9RHOB|nr:LysR substrate-binding domain-containing protein [Cognatishimia maritima]SHH75698.1 DNA-binding transcriptional regulator, LysR family [Cognatishimia maritima]